MRALVAGLAAASLLAVGLHAPTAHAAGETCRGVPATHVGSKDLASLTGTEGPDVIVTNGALNVDALGGDDLICSTDYGARIHAGAGDDAVWATENRAFGPTVFLGPGQDTFTGSSARDNVSGGEYAGTTHVDTERDVIDGGPAGPSPDSVESGQVGVPNPDAVRVGSATVGFRGLATPATVLAGGGGSALLLRPSPASSVVLDVSAATWSEDGATASFSGFTEFTVRPESGSADAGDGPRSLVFRGSDRADALTIDAGTPGSHDVRMGGGNDDLEVITFAGLPDGATYDGGDDRNDAVRLQLPRADAIDVRLGGGRFTTEDGTADAHGTMTGFDHAEVVARKVRLVGTSSANTLAAEACRTKVSGSNGGDYLKAYVTGLRDRPACKRRTPVLLGGRGHDTLRGTPRPDRLFGGRGNDVAVGRAGRDVCSAEKARNCEVRR